MGKRSGFKISNSKLINVPGSDRLPKEITDSDHIGHSPVTANVSMFSNVATTLFMFFG